jgi:hypothetical protein
MGASKPATYGHFKTGHEVMGLGSSNDFAGVVDLVN